MEQNVKELTQLVQILSVMSGTGVLGVVGTVIWFSLKRFISQKDKNDEMLLRLKDKQSDIEIHRVLDEIKALREGFTALQREFEEHREYIRDFIEHKNDNLFERITTLDKELTTIRERYSLYYENNTKK